LPSNIGLIFYQLGIFTGIKAGIERLCIHAQTGISGKTFQLVLAEGALVLSILMGEKIVMEFPEFILITGTLGSLGCPL